MSHYRTQLLKVLLACGGVLIGLVIAEVALHALGLPRFHKAHSSPRRFHVLQDGRSGEQFLVNKPSTTIAFQYDSDPRGYFGPANTVNHVTNSLGFRGSEFTPSRTPGTARLVFLGDSFTFGEGVRFEDTFAEVTRSLLVARLGLADDAVEAYNLGVGGYNTSNELFLLKQIGLPARPDAVVLCFVLNDAEPDLFHFDPVRGPVRRSRESEVHEGLDDARPPDTLLFNSRVAQAVWRFNHARKIKRQTEAYYHRLYHSDAPDWKRTQQALREMAALCRREQVPFIVMIFPILHELDQDYPFRSLHELVAKVADSSGATVVDLLPGFEGHRAADLWVHPTDQHPNEKAHHMAAEQLADHLSSWPALLKRIPASARTSK